MVGRRWRRRRRERDVGVLGGGSVGETREKVAPRALRRQPRGLPWPCWSWLRLALWAGVARGLRCRRAALRGRDSARPWLRRSTPQHQQGWPPCSRCRSWVPGPHSSSRRLLSRSVRRCSAPESTPPSERAWPRSLWPHSPWPRPLLRPPRLRPPRRAQTARRPVHCVAPVDCLWLASLAHCLPPSARHGTDSARPLPRR